MGRHTRTVTWKAAGCGLGDRAEREIQSRQQFYGFDKLDIPNSVELNFMTLKQVILIET